MMPMQMYKVFKHAFKKALTLAALRCDTSFSKKTLNYSPITKFPLKKKNCAEFPGIHCAGSSHPIITCWRHQMQVQFKKAPDLAHHLERL